MTPDPLIDIVIDLTAYDAGYHDVTIGLADPWWYAENHIVWCVYYDGQTTFHSASAYDEPLLGRLFVYDSDYAAGAASEDGFLSCTFGACPIQPDTYVVKHIRMEPFGCQNDECGRTAC